jgi:uncharacterized protein (TIGR03382 family)
MRRLLALAALVGCAADDAGQTSQPIYGGTTDSGDPSVVFLVYRVPSQPGFIYQCTGSLVGKRTVLTAAHCVQENVDAGKASDGFVYYGNDDFAADTDHRIGLAGARHHYLYAPGLVPPINDVAVVYLDADAPMDPVVLNDQHLEELALTGTTLRAVGWGRTNGQTGAGQRRQAMLPFAGLVSAQFVAAGDAQHGTCPGDSGGPLFATLGGVEKQVGITSYGNVQCTTGGSTFARVDTYTSTFIFPAIDNFEGPCKADGTCVTTGCRAPDPDCDNCGFDLAGTCNPRCAVPDQDCPGGKQIGAPCADELECESRHCVAAVDDPRIKYCSDPCYPGIGWCPGNQTCQDVGGQNLCVITPPTPSALGSFCGDGSACRSGLCDSRTHVCVEPCDPAQATSCPTGYECVESSLAPHVCAVAGTSDGGGCSTSGGVGWSWLVVGALVALSRRRR